MDIMMSGYVRGFGYLTMGNLFRQFLTTNVHLLHLRGFDRDVNGTHVEPSDVYRLPVTVLWMEFGRRALPKPPEP